MRPWLYLAMPRFIQVIIETIVKPFVWLLVFIEVISILAMGFYYSHRKRTEQCN